MLNRAVSTLFAGSASEEALGTVAESSASLHSEEVHYFLLAEALLFGVCLLACIIGCSQSCREESCGKDACFNRVLSV